MVAGTGIMLGGHVRAVFTLVTFIFIICVTATVTSFREIPLWRLEVPPTKVPDFLNDDENTPANTIEITDHDDQTESEKITKTSTSYGTLNQDSLQIPAAFVSSMYIALVK